MKIFSAQRESLKIMWKNGAHPSSLTFFTAFYSNSIALHCIAFTSAQVFLVVSLFHLVQKITHYFHQCSLKNICILGIELCPQAMNIAVKGSKQTPPRSRLLLPLHPLAAHASSSPSCPSAPPKPSRQYLCTHM
jgi:hypothetical protein